MRNGWRMVSPSSAGLSTTPRLERTGCCKEPEKAVSAKTRPGGPTDGATP
jgi:hypothetical protein